VTPLLQEYVARQAARRPDSVALVMGRERVTYGRLEEESNRLAWLLRDAGCRRGDRVCLFLAKRPAAIAAMLGVLKADCAYVPIDVTSPAARVEKIVEAADPRFAIVGDEASALVAELRDVAAISAEPADWNTYPADPLRFANTAHDPAHILFTSGSTGAPKGVVITHANVIRFVEWATSYFGTSESDRISGHPPLHFDLSTFDIYGTFLAGAQLHLVPASASLLPQKLAALIRESELTQWFSVPSIMSYMAKFDVIRHGDFPTLRRVLWCGEVLPTPTLVHWMERLPHATFTNLYGPTEATIASSYYTVPRIPVSETEPIPIGTACAGEELLVLDDDLRPAPAGEVGNLFIAGDGLSPGYWRDREKTDAVFVPDPRGGAAPIYCTGDLARLGDDGLVYFLGRADTQIKHRGYRIELGEIEAALNAVPSLRESAVVAVATDGFEGTTICCAYASANGAVEPAQLREELRRALPTYMLPSRWLELERLPKNGNGKIDRRALKERFES
jgi:amino acid adenylation domain-containing protein